MILTSETVMSNSDIRHYQTGIKYYSCKWKANYILWHMQLLAQSSPVNLQYMKMSK